MKRKSERKRLIILVILFLVILLACMAMKVWIWRESYPPVSMTVDLTKDLVMEFKGALIILVILFLVILLACMAMKVWIWRESYPPVSMTVDLTKDLVMEFKGADGNGTAEIIKNPVTVTGPDEWDELDRWSWNSRVQTETGQPKSSKIRSLSPDRMSGMSWIGGWRTWTMRSSPMQRHRTG